MKATIKYFVALVAIALGNHALAQRQYEGQGHGYAKIFVQRDTVAQRGAERVNTVLWGPSQEAYKYIQDEVELQDGVKVRISQSAVRQEIWSNLADVLGEFHQDSRGRYTVSEPYTFDTQEDALKAYSRNHKDSYITIDSKGVITPHYDGSIMGAYATRQKRYRSIVTITDNVTGRSADIFIDCFNVTFPTEHYGPGPTPPPMPPAPPAKKDTIINKIIIQVPPVTPPPTFHCTASDFYAFPVKLITRNAVRRNGVYDVVLRWKSVSRHDFTITDSTDNRIEGVVPGYYDRLTVHPDVPTNPTAKKWDVTYVLTGCDNLRLSTTITVDNRRWFRRNEGWIIPTGLAIIAGGVAEYLHHKHESNLNTNWVHDSNTSPWDPGSGQNVPNGPTFGAVRQPSIGASFAFHIGH